MTEGKKSVLLTHRNSIQPYLFICAKEFVCKGWEQEKEEEGEEEKKEEKKKVENKKMRRQY